MNFYYFFYACLLFILLDATWIFLNINYYMKLTYKVQKENFVLKIPPFIIAYIFLLILLYFCIRYIEKDLNNYKSINYFKVIQIGILFGIAIYGMYSYTTCVFLKNYNYYNAFIDTIWGGVLYSLPPLCYFYLIKNY